MYIRPEALQEALKEEPLSKRYPTLFAASHADWFIAENVSLREICNELRKLYIQNCGFPHENDEWNPGRKTCSDRGIDQDYNVSCPHAPMVGNVFRQAQCAATLLGERIEGERLYKEFRRENDSIDNMDNSCRPLYQITIDGTTGSRSQAFTESDTTTLARHGVCTDVSQGEGERLRESLCAKQDVYARRILELRDAFLALLGA